MVLKYTRKRERCSGQNLDEAEVSECQDGFQKIVIMIILDGSQVHEFHGRCVISNGSKKC